MPSDNSGAAGRGGMSVRREEGRGTLGSQREEYHCQVALRTSDVGSLSREMDTARSQKGRGLSRGCVGVAAEVEELRPSSEQNCACCCGLRS